MAKLLGLLVLLGLGWLVVKRLLGPPPVPRDPPQPRFEKTVRCARCGVHVPAALARPADNGHVCKEPGCAGHPEKEPRR